MGFEQLEPLVRECGGVDRDLRAHAPRRMCERLLWRDVLELVARPSAKRTAGGGQHERVDALRIASVEALEGSRVLAVHWNQNASAALERGQRELACRDEALFVRERQRNPALERPERRREAGEADDRVEHDVRLRALEQLDEVAAGLRQGREPVDRLRA